MLQTEIAPHGGHLINRFVCGAEADSLRERAQNMTPIALADRRLSDLEMIGNGAFSPLEGFMGRADYENCIVNKRLANGLPWTIPVTLAVTTDEAQGLNIGEEVALIDTLGNILAVLELDEIYRYDKEREARLVYATTEVAHPGVRNLFRRGDIHLGGKIKVLQERVDKSFPQYRLSPLEVRREFAAKGWRKIVGFQTRNPIHRAHEYITKAALEIMDGLLIHPLVSYSKEDDIPADVRMKCYEVLIENYYPKERVLLSVLPAASRYAGPREAILHAIVRKNFGCTHFIVGRDHAGVGNYYGTFDAQYIFDEFSTSELEITPLLFDHAFYSPTVGSMGTDKTMPERAEKIALSGTKVRQMLMDGQIPPPEFTRPEVAQVLIDAMKARRK
ncbi:sulfate adenylyltransferase [Abditibacterium utsteinense]|uniref:Sulfate adenylyltransferase n=1 Tax=Abditibacterium utsteinense TaxID=1960156 RepID=A0A2S8SV10_9BACT|nr:sulfate adenylyltransferase [Abditibacterium utsteinense]PQV64635.1 sulfate adenylyltransferase [Abditibacterium utsteinense]